ncbi:MAG TPA: Bax inhibitor-1 family protein [Pyrinomonadaceae bacterium]|nr:Bax inhibitor-1 family protein [Pyrinomonadaceae bacterium]
MNTYESTFGNNTAANALPEERARFIRKTYLHLAAAILAFVVLESFLFVSGVAYTIMDTMRIGGKFSWLLVLAAFMGVSWLANSWANSQTSKPIQYLGLLLGVIAYAVIFVPLMFIAANFGGGDVIMKAGIVTLGLFLGISSVVFITRSDFSFLGPIVAIGGFVALGFIAASILFGFSLGSLFAFIMVAFAGTAILYETSNVMHRYHPTQHVAASLTLFAAIALLFWYVLSIFSSRD